MDIRTLQQTGDDEGLAQFRELLESANSRVEREIVQLTIDLLMPRPGIALGSQRLLVDNYLPWIERRNVHRARGAGATWAGIARILGRSRQSTHERFAGQIGLSELLPPPAIRQLDEETAVRHAAARERREAAQADDPDLDGHRVPW